MLEMHLNINKDTRTFRMCCSFTRMLLDSRRHWSRKRRLQQVQVLGAGACRARKQGMKPDRWGMHSGAQLLSHGLF
jgi:hypothetical protein